MILCEEGTYSMCDWFTQGWTPKRFLLRHFMELCMQIFLLCTSKDLRCLKCIKCSVRLWNSNCDKKGVKV